MHYSSNQICRLTLIVLLSMPSLALANEQLPKPRYKPRSVPGLPAPLGLGEPKSLSNSANFKGKAKDETQGKIVLPEQQRARILTIVRSIEATSLPLVGRFEGLNPGPFLITRPHSKAHSFRVVTEAEAKRLMKIRSASTTE